MAKKELSYTEAATEIERILNRLRNEELDVDALAAQVARATELIARCKEQLLKTETEVNRILEK